jgi:nitronate monooxygenase
MKEEAARTGDAERMQMWAGQAARFAQAEPAAVIAQTLWKQALQLLT